MNTTSREFLNEAELLESCIHQDRRAQKALYELYAPRMLTLCIRYIGDRERAWDILHDGFITVFEKIDSYSGSGSFEGWMRKIFVNTALMSLRKGDVLKYTEELNIAEREVSPEYSALENINSKELLRLIATMPVGFRTVFNMYVIEGYSHQEIADQMKISEGSSRSQLSRARIWLQERLKEEKRG
jgi:RNA polymerase sigma-70 factor (ECF subfamily)